MLVSQHLHLDVARIDDGLLDVNFAVTERPLGFAARRIERRLKLFASVDQSHAFAAAARSRFQHHWIANSRGNLLCLLKRLDSTRCAGHERNAGLFHGLARARFRSHGFHRCGCGPNELHSRVGAGLRKLCVL